MGPLQLPPTKDKTVMAKDKESGEIVFVRLEEVWNNPKKYQTI